MVSFNFDADGLTVGSLFTELNGNGGTNSRLVLESSNGSGSIQIQMVLKLQQMFSKSNLAGFSIVKYSGDWYSRCNNWSTIRFVPRMIIIKNLTENSRQ